MLESVQTEGLLYVIASIIILAVLPVVIFSIWKKKAGSKYKLITAVLGILVIAGFAGALIVIRDYLFLSGIISIRAYTKHGFSPEFLIGSIRRWGYRWDILYLLLVEAVIIFGLYIHTRETTRNKEKHTS